MARLVFRYVSPVLCCGKLAWTALLVMLASHAGGPICAAQDNEDNAPRNVPPPVGQVIKVTLPIQNSVADRVIARTRRAVDRLNQLSADGGAKILIFEFTTGDSEFGRGSSFHKASELADFIAGSELDGIKTYAFLPGTVKGHAVLPIIACHEIVMHPESDVGEAGIDEKGPVAAHLRSTYRRIADQRKTVRAEIALGMLDGQLEVLKVRTPTSEEFVFRDDLDDLRKRVQVIDVDTLIPEGEMGLFAAQDARDLGFVKLLVEDLRTLAQSLDLPQEVIEPSPWLDGETLAVRINLHGEITEKSAYAIRRMIEKQITREKATFVCLDIDSPGGSVEECLALAVYLSKLNPARVRTVAYVADEAGGAAALIALACDHLVMHREAELGGMDVIAIEANRPQLEYYMAQIKAFTGEKHRSWSLPAALIDPELSVSRYRLRGKNRLEYFCEEELAAQNDPKEWQVENEITEPDKTLMRSGAEAKTLGLAHHLVHNFDQLRQLYGIEDDLTPIEPTWVDVLVDALARPEVAWALLVIGGMALIAELQTPGVGVGGFVATICFVVFFWSKYRFGTANEIEILLFVLGVGFLLLEIFVIPGFGICGLGGGALIIVSLVLASQRFVIPESSGQIRDLRESMMVVGGAGLGILVLATVLRRYLPHAPMFNRVMLHPPEGEEIDRIAQSESLVDYEHLLGQTGATTTQLTPGGKARFGDQLIDVMADGELIETETPIIVVEVQGNRVVVAAAGR
jgi:membrane-bound ClpP family serine protease